MTTPDTAIEVGDSVQLSATARGSAGAPVEDAAFDWATSDAGVATVSETGQVMALAAGEVEISATAARVTGRLHLTVASAPPEGPVTIGLEEVASGLAFPLYLTRPPRAAAAAWTSAGLTPPLLEYDHDAGRAVTGGYVYRDPRLQGQYLFADFCGGWVHSISADGEGADPVDWPALAPGGKIPGLGQDAAGELYVPSSDGGVLRIVAR